MRRIVVGVDGSAGSIRALRHAARIGALTEARLEAVHVWHMTVSIEPLWAPIELEPDADSMAVLRDAVERAGIADITLRARRGSPAGELIAASDDADLLVVGSRGRGGFAGALLGSVSAACAEYAHCPVLVVHEPRAGRRD